ncbi:2-phosphosulfolactate phosphatase [Dictyobacter aurantiacus]|uniref:Probable 2-phosphosulfolactate phosphatase n=1 Tax=Dictyobacter aurantiacus TaxID=1936993 RepID=A0A401ZET2_9CHLR|nr:2-phosphosulfolactate phosphatase [Dictyobacter aurantiacus]GCE05372.1 putative 2-phosphosulfolactate phosphatase [Dictyobacter aurantiacus]
MELYVHMSPADAVAARPADEDVFIVIDVIRATTALTAIFDRGAQRVFAADTVEQARTASRLKPGRLLCGERHARALPGFDYGNSPVQFSHSDLNRRELILTTTNGTRAFYACPEHSVCLAGCFYNARAVTAYALAHARRRESNVHIVCAAEHGRFALDDTVCAGYLAQEIQHQQPEIVAHESVIAARGLYQLYPPPGLATYCHSARQVIDSGLGADIDFCMRQNGSDSIARLIGKEAETGLLILERVQQIAG